MVKRLISALEYPQSDSLNINDDPSFKKLVVWLEKNKINKATPGTLKALENTNSNDWYTTFDKYKIELECPNLGTKIESLRWILGVAVQIETQKNKDVYLKHAVDNLKITNVPSVVAENPLDKLDFRSPEFVEGINNVARLLKITPHPDPLITLKAVSSLVSTRLNPDALAHPEKYIVKGTPYPLQNSDLGFEITDLAVKQAAKILRMLYIHDLRDLQTKANELIVAVQSITANPKTDTRLGKVGR